MSNPYKNIRVKVTDYNRIVEIQEELNRKSRCGKFNIDDAVTVALDSHNEDKNISGQ